MIAKKGEFPVEVCGDSTVAIAFASRQGLGRQKHVMTRFLWVQHAVKSKRISLKKVDTRENVADARAKPVCHYHPEALEGRGASCQVQVKFAAHA